MVLPALPKAVVFDMDGLLFDTEALYSDALIAVASRRGCDLPREATHSLIGFGWSAVQTNLARHLGQDCNFDEYALHVREEFHSLARDRLRLKNGAVELLRYLQLREVPCAIATSSHREAVDANLARFSLQQRFQAIVAKGDYIRAKPAPDPFLVAASRVEMAPKDCLALEDSHAGVRSASAAGMMTVMVPDLLGVTEEMKSLCCAVAADLHEVRRWLL